MARFVVEFYRTRDADLAHAVVGRHDFAAGDAGGAIKLAIELAGSLSMPQIPDAMDVREADGTLVYEGPIEGP